MLVSCHAALTTEKTEPAGQEQKLEKTPTKKQPLLIEHHDFNGLRFENKQRSQNACIIHKILTSHIAG